MTVAEPYVGPRSFEPHEHAIFFGRFDETDRLVSLVIANKAVVLYAQSGAGKTSLLNAGLIPALEAEGDFQFVPRVRVVGLADQLDELPADAPSVYEVNAAVSVLESSGQDPAGFSATPSLRSVLDQVCAGDPDKPTLLLFDQFEELFTTRAIDWEDRERFLGVLSQLLDDYPDLRMLFSIREEWLADIDERGSRFRNGLRARLRLHGLRRGQAQKAIREPVTMVADPVEFQADAAERLVRDLATDTVEGRDGQIHRIPGKYVEPVQLQVVCSAIWRRHDTDSHAITEADLEAVGSVDQALADYYDECVIDAAGDRYEDELFLRNWFEHQLITASGTRGLVHLSQTGAAGVPIHVVEHLQGLHIVKMERRSGARWVELSHDRLMQPIKQANARWREIRGVDTSRQSMSTLERIRKIGTVRIGMTVTPPFCFEDENGILTGEAIVVAREIFRELGVYRIEPVFSEFARMFDGLDNGKFDVASCGIFVTPEREQRFRVSLPTVVAGTGLLVPTGNPKGLHSLEDARDRPDVVLGMPERSVEHDIALEIGMPAERIVGFRRDQMAVDALRSGRIDGFVQVTLDLPYFLEKAGPDRFEIADPFSDPIRDGAPHRGQMALMMRKSDEELAQAVDEALRRFVGTARHAELVAPFGITREMLPDV